MGKITVLGAGSWGATLAQHLAGNIKSRQKNAGIVSLWEFDKERARSLNATGTLPTLPALKLPPSVKVTDDMAEALSPLPEIIVAAVPSFAFTQTLNQLKKILERFDTFQKEDIPGIVIATKGFVGNRHLLPSVETAKIFPFLKKIAILTGPSHAEEVVRKMPTVVTIASSNLKFAGHVQEIFASEYLRVYTNSDIIGSGLAGALKNIYAIAAGISDGLGLGDNTKAALVTRSLAEMSRIGTALGGKPQTFLGLSGVGDLIVTCYSRHSRNRNLGEMLGQGLKLKDALKKMTMVSEGIYASKSLEIIKRQNPRVFPRHCHTPIADEIYAILFHNKSPVKSISSLMTRPLKSE